MSNNTKLLIENMNLHYGNFHALKDINMHIPEKEITAFISTQRLWKIHTSEILKQNE